MSNWRGLVPLIVTGVFAGTSVGFYALGSLGMSIAALSLAGLAGFMAVMAS